jgi:hypothetical protein
VTDGRRRTWLLGGLALAGAALELANAFFVQTPQAAVGIAGLFVLAWFRVMQEKPDGILLSGALYVFELAGLAFGTRNETADWVIQLSLAAIAVIGLVVVIATMRQPRLTPPGR